MIEELTPGVLATSMVLILLVAPVLTAVLASVFLWRYRRAVVRAMWSHSGARRALSPIHAVSEEATEVSHRQLYQYARYSAYRDLAGIAIAVLLAALPLSIVAQSVYPNGMGAAGFALGVWIYAWPIVPAAFLVLPKSRVRFAGAVLCWWVVYGLLTWWGSSWANIPAQYLGGVVIEARSGVTPWTMGLLWLAVNGVPSVLCLLCFNRWVRAVAPLVLLLVTLLMSGLWGAWIWASMPTGFEALVWVAEYAPVYPGLVIAGYFLLLLALLLLLGWALVRAVARAYGHKRLSDRALALDAVYLAFLSSYGLWLVLGGFRWLLAVPLAYAMYRLVLNFTQRLRAAPVAVRELCFLRVFALGRRSQQLADAVARYWRSIGSIQMITGPDVATTTVQPHQFLDYLSGNLQRHFVSDAKSLNDAVEGLDGEPDPDGRYRVNALFCYEDTWQAVLPALTASGALLMDLRGFSENNAGCRDELYFIAAQVPVSHCVLLVDDSTDRGYLLEVLGQALQGAGPDSVNRGCAAAEFRQLQLQAGDTGMRSLVEELLSETHPRQQARES